MGPLAGYRIIEIAGIGPGPFGAMCLADMGAEVIRVGRQDGSQFHSDSPRLDFLNRGKRSICVDLKQPEGIEVVLKLVETADALVEGFRPGIMEKLGLGPEVCLARNPRLVFGRMTGWGQEGPLAQRAGHDINYIALSGALHAMGRAGEKPAIPLNLVGDFGGGGLLLAYGVVCALLEAQKSGEGQVVDAAMVDGASLLMTSIFAAHQAGYWSAQRGTNMLDSGAFFYEVYETADGRHVSLGAIEPQFYAQLMQRLGFAADDIPPQFDPAQWPALKAKVAARVREKTRDEWCAIFDGSDACYAPVLAMDEITGHPHHRARGSFPEQQGVWQPRPAPRFSRTAAQHSPKAVPSGADTLALLQALGYSQTDIDALRGRGAVS